MCGVLATDAFSDGRAWLQEMWTGVGRQREYEDLLRRARLAEEAMVLGEAPEVAPIEEIIPYAPDDLRPVQVTLPVTSAVEPERVVSDHPVFRPAPTGIPSGTPRGTVPSGLYTAVRTAPYRYVTSTSSALPWGRRTITLLTGLGMV